jgi:hypothetical protein
LIASLSAIYSRIHVSIFSLSHLFFLSLVLLLDQQKQAKEESQWVRLIIKNLLRSL